jgi:hypothetical protein
VNRENQVKLAQLEDLLNAAKKEHDEYVAAMERLVKQRLDDQRHAMEIDYNEQNLHRIELLDKLIRQVNALNYVYYENAKYFDEAADLQRLTVAVVALQQALKTNGPLKPEVDALKKISGSDQLVQALVSSLPEETLLRGVPRVSDLEHNFSKLKKDAIGASYAPRANTFMGAIYAKLMALFVFPDESFNIDDKSIDATIGRAHFYIKHNKLHEAVEELESIADANTREVLKNWIASAKKRVHADQVNEILTNHLVNTSQFRDEFLPSASQENKQE